MKDDATLSEEGRALLAKATPGIWRTCRHPESDKEDAIRVSFKYVARFQSQFGRPHTTAEESIANAKLTAWLQEHAEALLSAQARLEQAREVIELWFSPWGAAKGARWEALTGDRPFDPNVALEMIRDFLGGDDRHGPYCSAQVGPVSECPVCGGDDGR